MSYLSVINRWMQNRTRLAPPSIQIFISQAASVAVTRYDNLQINSTLSTQIEQLSAGANCHGLSGHGKRIVKEYCGVLLGCNIVYLESRTSK